MWDALTNIVNGHNGLFVIIATVIIVFTLIRLSKKGGFAVHTGFLSLGGADREREIIRHQIEVAHASSFEIPELLRLNMDDYRIKYLIERVYDKVVEWVIFNHISTSPIYIDSKSCAIYNLIVMVHGVDGVDTDDVRKKIREWVTHLIDQLVHTRKYYTDFKRSI